MLDASLYEKNFEGAKWVMSPPLTRKERPGNFMGRHQPGIGAGGSNRSLSFYVGTEDNG